MKFFSFTIIPITLLCTTPAKTNSDHENTIASFKQRMAGRAASPSDSPRSLLHTNPMKGPSFRHLQKTIEEELANSVNCNHEAVKEWVTGNVEGGRCEDFAEVLGGMEMCQKYKDYSDPSECLLLDDTPSFNLEGGGLGPSPLEECMYFVNHLLPHPYFMDLDSIMPLFGSGFDFPSHHECQESDVHQCEVEIRYEQEYSADFLAQLDVNLTAAPTPAPMMDTAPCTRCDFYYDSDDVCFAAPCEHFECQEPTQPLDVLPENRTVEICFQNTRSDLFGFTEHRIGDMYGCSISTEEKLWSTHFHRGVTNIQHMEFKIGTHPEQVAPEGVGLSYCQLSVEGVPCNSCTFCGSNDTNPHMAMDCSNIVEGGSTSCDEEEDFIFGIARKLVILQDYQSEAPTTAPKNPVPQPTLSNSDSSNNKGQDFFGEDMDLNADELEGVVISSAVKVVPMGAGIVVGTVFGWFLFL